MFLKRLELKGFKSFPDRVVLEFVQGITAVVGPNGSGKSNISDALRWVLGEQSVKSLRGQKMEDVIFSGTQSKRSLGMATVTMTIDNADNALGVDYSEVSISRSVYRTGESDYAINGTSCRLKDIYELFMDTGIGKEGYSIIGQGRIEEVLSIRSDERRFMFEEVAGIVKYKSRKSESENKLEKERQNLERVNDIITELSEQELELSKEAERAKAYLELKERLKLVQVNIFLADVDKLEGELKEIQKRLDELKAQHEDCTQRAETVKERIKTVKEDLKTAEGEIKSKRDLIAEARSKSEQCSNSIILKQEQISHITGEIMRLKSELSSRRKGAKALQLEEKTERERLDGLNLEFSDNTSLLEQKEKEFEDAKKGMSDAERMLEDYNAELVSLMRESGILKAQGESLVQRLNYVQDNRKNLAEQQKEISLRIAENQSKLRLVLEKTEVVGEQNKAINDAVQRLTQERDKLSLDARLLNDKLETIRREHADKSSKRRILSELENNYEGFNRSVKAILTKNEPSWGICGAVGELLQVPAQYETAIFVALGGALQNIVAKDEEGIKQAINFLKSAQLGRATFLPLNVISGKGKRLGVRDAVLKEWGVLGIAKELVGYEPIYEGVFSELLDRVVIVDTIDNAIALNKKYNYTLKIVTIDGELFNPGGAITGGSMGKSQNNIFGRTREIKTLGEDIEILLKQEQEHRTELSSMQQNISSIDEEVSDKKDELTDRMLEEANLVSLKDQLTNTIDELREKGQSLSNDADNIDGSIVSFKNEIEANRIAQEHSEQSITSLKQEMSDFQESLASKKELGELRGHELTQIKVKIGGLEESIKSAERNLMRVLTEMESNDSGLSAITDQLNENEQRLSQRNEEIMALRHELGLVNEERKLLEDEIVRNTAALKTYTDLISRLEDEHIKGLEETSQLQNEITKQEGLQNRITEDNRRLYDHMWEEYGLTLNRARQDFVRLDMELRTLQKEETTLKKDIADLGYVNVNALTEYEKLKERLDFLKAQRDDILKAEAALIDLIKQLTTQMETQFMEQFKLISENFSIVFKEMFGGGKAVLSLFDETKVLESGIEIIAQPPDKNLQSLSLLSGGERSLTAIALLFAILRLKPSPFCVLDEIDAALDDANVKRFANFLAHYCKETQFIVVTHRKGTMEVCDRMYGISMQEGISKILSVEVK